ncbi:HAMP domain-containing sensor histidine kinase [uncultured Flavobacterium sp.]|uniref:sensor histidine kinase n=1 Tax=uncultured Flavobacterium sp. TaxID=165435 RepID=UPI0030EF8658
MLKTAILLLMFYHINSQDNTKKSQLLKLESNLERQIFLIDYNGCNKSIGNSDIYSHRPKLGVSKKTKVCKTLVLYQTDSLNSYQNFFIYFYSINYLKKQLHYSFSLKDKSAWKINKSIIYEDNNINSDNKTNATYLDTGMFGLKHNTINLIFLFLFMLFVSVFIYKILLNKKSSLILNEKNKVINNQKQLLELSNETKKKLFALISHDLINPFNALLGYSQLLKDDFGAMSDMQKMKFIDVIYIAANNNYTLVKNLLDWSRTQQNLITVNKTHLNLFVLIEETIKPYDLLAENKNIKIILPQNLDIVCHADEILLKSCVSNVFSNAIKFTPRNGAIEFSIEQKENCFQITISDTGVGMSDKQINSLLKLLESNTTLGTENETGTGLGMLICKEFMELQDGLLEIRSQIGIGTCVTLKLPDIN